MKAVEKFKLEKEAQYFAHANFQKDSTKLYGHQK